MKIRNTSMWLIALFVLTVENASAQGWLDKALKVADKIEKTLDAVDGNLTPTADRNIEIYTNDTNVPVRFVSCIRNGEDVTINFEIGNYTNTDLEIRKFGSTKKQGFTLTEASAITDNAGYNYELYSATIGGKTEIKYTGSASVNGFFNLHKETYIKANMVIKGVTKSATSFQIVKIAFNNNISGAYYTRYFSFKNVPILSMADITRIEQEKSQRELDKLLAKAEAGDANAQYLVGTLYYNNGDYPKALDYYTKSADGGNANAQGELAYFYLLGDGNLDRDRVKDHTKALSYAQKSVVKGNPKAHFVLGVLHLNGEVVEKNKDKQIEYLTYAANRELVDAQEWLGQEYRFTDQILSAQWYKKAADNGGIYGIRNTGDNYFSGRGVEVDKKKALTYYLKGVDVNDATCLYSAGLMYRRGNGCEQNLPKAKELLLKSAAQDNVNGFRELAYYYRYDEVDDLKAIDYFNRAIAKGDTHSLYYLAEMHEKGIGTLKNPAKAKELYTKSAETGDKDSQYKLGMMAKEQKDLKGAFKWLTKSADAEQSDAQYELGLMYYYAKGPVKNNKKAAQYIEKAHKQGNKDAEKVWNSLQLWKYL